MPLFANNYAQGCFSVEHGKLQLSAGSTSSLSAWMQQGIVRRRALLLGIGSLLLVSGVLYLLHKLEVLQLVDTNALGVRQRSAYQFPYNNWCDLLVNDGLWLQDTAVSCDTASPVLATCGSGVQDNWEWSHNASSCGSRRVALQEAQDLLEGKWVVIMGDSVGRNIFLSLMRLFRPEQELVIEKHQNIEQSIDAIKVSFLWSPYSADLIANFEDWQAGNVAPDVIIAGVSLWHMLHFRSSQDYAEQLTYLLNATNTFLDHQVRKELRLFWLSASEIQNQLLKSEDKQRYMTPQRVDEYNAVMQQSCILVPQGPYFLIDMHRLTLGCGPTCTHDGIHYANSTYDAALQVWLNSLKLSLSSPEQRMRLPL